MILNFWNDNDFLLQNILVNAFANTLANKVVKSELVAKIYSHNPGEIDYVFHWAGRESESTDM